MNGIVELKNRGDSLLAQCQALAQTCGDPAMEKRFADYRQGLQQRELMVVTVGETDTGKSSLLNGLLGETVPVFPVDASTCTNAVTVVRYGETEQILVHFADGRQPVQITREEISAYVTEQKNADNFRQVSVLDIRLNNPFLQSGLVFVDTPGLGSIHAQHGEITMKFLPAADLVLFVSDVQSVMTQSELDFLKCCYDHCQNILFPLTKKDLVSDCTGKIADNRAKICSALNLSQAEVKILPVSSFARQKHLQTGNKLYGLSSNFEALETLLWDCIGKVAASRVLNPYLQAAEKALTDWEESLSAQQILLERGEEENQKTLEKVQQEILRLKKLQQVDAAAWQNELNLFFSQLATNMNPKLQKLMANAKNLLEERKQTLGNRICQKGQYQAVARQIDSRLLKELLALQNGILEEVTQKLEELNTDLGIQVPILENWKNQENSLPQETIHIDVKKVPLAKRAEKLTGKLMISQYLGSLAGSALAVYFQLPPAEAQELQKLCHQAGLWVGAALGGLNASQAYDASSVMQVERVLSQHITEAGAQIQADISNYLALLRSGSQQELAFCLKQRIETLGDWIQKTQETVHLDRKERAKQMPILKKHREAVCQRKRQLQQLQADPFAEPEKPEPQQPNQKITYAFL